MDILISNEAANALERRLSDAVPEERLSLLVEVAWHLRQRDTRRALAYADEASAVRGVSGPAGTDGARIDARLDLVYGEAMRLSAELDDAERRIGRALQRFEAAGDHAGCADANWLLAWIGHSRGNPAQREEKFMAMAEHARRADDALRLDLAEAAQARFAVQHNPAGAMEKWGKRFPADAVDMHPALKTWVCDFHAMHAFQTCDYARAIAWYSQQYDMAHETGQVERVVISTTNLAASFTNLNDYQSALEWSVRGLEFARRIGWPEILGMGLMETAMQECNLGRFESAHDLLVEALDVLKPFSNSRTYSILLNYTGQLEIDRANYAEALKNYRQSEERLITLNLPGSLSIAKRGQAHALCELGRADEALSAAHAALELAITHRSASSEIEALKVLARIHARHPLPPPPGMTAPSASLHYLNRALEVASKIDDFIVPCDLFDAIAREYAKVGDTAQAYSVSLQAIAAREKTHTAEAMNRAVAAQIRHQTERARAEAEHNRKLAETEVHRAEALARMNSTLDRLSTIGREITAHLDERAVFETLNRHVHGLLDASHFAIYLLDSTNEALDCVFGIEDGKPLPPIRVELSNQRAYVVRCARERREIVKEEPTAGDDATRIPGTWQCGSALFAPLTVGERLLGVMSTQSPRAHAYGESERLVFQTLCAYGAIALDNAMTYRQLAASHRALREAQQQLVFQEKMASLGTLTAGVAHEINNPVNFSHAGAQTLAAELENFRLFLMELTGDDTEPEIVAAINARINHLTVGIDTILQGTTRIKGLVQDLRTFSRLDQAEKKAVPIADNLLSTVNLVRTQYASVAEIRCELIDNPVLDCWPAQLNQVFMNLIVNACQAIQAKQRETKDAALGLLSIRSRIDGQHLLIEFEDNGCGMPAGVIDHIFEPFFTTKNIGEGTGLGLSISFGIIEKHRGDIRVASTEGEGTCFTIVLPLSCEQAEA
ncbi:MAG TPA: ATP-binding protein [Paucimonas sp.]|nr:ATP-binding protein [Paucimonas sp.]